LGTKKAAVIALSGFLETLTLFDVKFGDRSSKKHFFNQ